MRLRFPLLSPALLLALAPVASADDSAEILADVRKATDALASRDGFGVDAAWKLEGEKLENPVKGQVRAIIRAKDRFVMLRGTFEDGRDATVYQKGDVLAAQDPETLAWGSVKDDARATFVLQIFNMKTFLERSQAMGVKAREERSDEGWRRLVYEADAEKLKGLLAEADAGKALTSGTLENATMTVALEVERGTYLPRLLEVTIHADSTHAPLEPKKDDSEIPDPWDEKTEPRVEPGDERPQEPEKKEPPAPREPVKEKITVTIRAVPDFKANLDVPVPDEVRKVLGN